MTTAALLRLKVGDYVPQFDADLAVKALANAATFTDLALAWFSIALDYEMTRREIEPVIHEVHATQKAMIGDVQRMIIESLS